MERTENTFLHDSQKHPVAIIDIGSNSIRLVVFEGLIRAPSTMYNEKALCALGRSVSATGNIAEENWALAIETIHRFSFICNHNQVSEIKIIATAAVREAKNGTQFVAAIEAIIKYPVAILSGADEASLAGVGVQSSFGDADGLVGDLGGGSLELISVANNQNNTGISLKLGGLRLEADSNGDLNTAESIISQNLDRSDTSQLLSDATNKPFYLVGGTWRALGRLYLEAEDYPLKVMHQFEIAPKAMLEYCGSFLASPDADLYDQISLPKLRRQLLPYGVLLLKKILERAEFNTAYVSAAGVREGCLFQMLDQEQQRLDPLIEAAAELAKGRSRSMEYDLEFFEWSSAALAVFGLKETAREKRLRNVACLLADITWRAHPDYRGAQAVNLVSHGAFTTIEHSERAFLALVMYHRHARRNDGGFNESLLKMVNHEMQQNALRLALLMRLAISLSAGIPSILPHIKLCIENGSLKLNIPSHMHGISGEAIDNRLKKMANFLQVTAESKI